MINEQNDIIIEARWIKSINNGLAKALSQSNYTLIANLCLRGRLP